LDNKALCRRELGDAAEANKLVEKINEIKKSLESEKTTD